ncbi:hypothetical protein BZA77DRAFT_299580 [Pyronema omphalodes]|nr:hypothetical protein BZA77DRAFT_299580 [Pyronema omphalodes]
MWAAELLLHVLPHLPSVTVSIFCPLPSAPNGICKQSAASFDLKSLPILQIPEPLAYYNPEQFSPDHSPPAYFDGSYAASGYNYAQHHNSLSAAPMTVKETEESTPTKKLSPIVHAVTRYVAHRFPDAEMTMSSFEQNPHPIVKFDIKLHGRTFHIIGDWFPGRSIKIRVLGDAPCSGVVCENGKIGSDAQTGVAMKHARRRDRIRRLIIGKWNDI